MAHSLSSRQPRHIALSHTGALPEQLLFEVHCTQRLLVSLQTEVGDTQAIAFEVVHCTQAPALSPEAAQAVAPSRAEHSMSPAQARQALF